MKRNFGLPNPEAPLQGLEDHWKPPEHDPLTWWQVITIGFVTIIALITVYILLVAVPVRAHDAKHPENNEWLRQLASGRGPCCDGSDAVRVDDPDWTIAEDGKFTFIKDGKPEIIECRRNSFGGWGEQIGEANSHGRYCVRLKVYPEDKADQETAWFFVPDMAVVSYSGDGSMVKGGGRNQDGQTRVWPMTSSFGGGRVTVFGVRCFLPGVLG